MGRFLRATIESVLAQQYPRLEYWVIDGGSTDDSLAIVREWAHDQRLHWLSEPDGGQSDAINKGLARCQGAIFGWLNADDRLLPGALDVVARAWLDGARPAIIYGRARLIDAQGRDLGYAAAQSSHMSLGQLLNLRSFLAQPATFAPTAVVRQVGGVDPALHYAMDLDLWVKLAERVPIRHAPCDLAEFRLHADSKSVSLATHFIADVAAVLDGAAARGLISARHARARAQIFAARTHLTPEVGDVGAALGCLAAACRAEWRVAPEALFVLGKALVRQAIGERAWAWVRLLQTKLS